MFLDIIQQSDLWLHLLSSALLFVIVYFIEVQYFKRIDRLRNAFIQIFLASVIDLDHLLSTPIFAEARCSINNHVLHSWGLFPAYALGLLSRFKYFFLSIIMHLVIDFLGCLL